MKFRGVFHPVIIFPARVVELHLVTESDTGKAMCYINLYEVMFFPCFFVNQLRFFCRNNIGSSLQSYSAERHTK